MTEWERLHPLPLHQKRMTRMLIRQKKDNRKAIPMSSPTNLPMTRISSLRNPA